jgi:hypothetical protein
MHRGEKFILKPRIVIKYPGTCLGKWAPGLYPGGKAAEVWR